jgi:hypothetical protein
MIDFSKGVPPFHLFPSPSDMRIPADLVGWLIEDLDADARRQTLSLPLFREKLKGYRAQSLPKEKAVPLLVEGFLQDFGCRVEVRARWLKQREADLRSMSALSPQELGQSIPKHLSEKGFPAVYWHCLFSEDPLLQSLAQKLLEELHVQPAQQVENISWTMAYGRSPVIPEPPPDVAARSGLAGELRRLKDELEQTRKQRKELEARAATLQSSVRNLENGIAGLQDRLRDSAQALRRKEESERAAADRAAALESRLQASASSEKRIHDFEKRLRALEHDLTQAREESRVWAEKAQSLDREKTAAAERAEWLEDSLQLLLKIRGSGVSKPVRRRMGGLLIVGSRDQIPAEYYQAASSSGTAIQYQPLFRRTPELEDRAGKSDGVLLLLTDWAELEAAQDFLGFLRKKKVRVRILPWLSAEDFQAVLSVF